MKSESRIFNTLRRVAPALLLTLAYAGVAQAQPIMALPCASLPTNRVYSIPEGTTPGADAYIKASDVAEWSFPGAGSDTCSTVGTARACAGLSVTLSAPGSPDSKTPKFTGTADIAGTVKKITIKAASAIAPADSCTAEFTFRVTSSGGGGWGEPEANGTGGATGDGGTAAMGGAEANGGDGATGGGGAAGGAEANGGGATNGDAGEAGSPSSGGASGGAVASGGTGLGGNVGNAAGTGGGIHAGGVPAASPDDASGESCSCSLPGQTPSSNRSAGTAIMIGLLFGNARRRSQSSRG